MIFPLVQDFADALAAMPREHPRYRILKLLNEAVRRDVHFIDRHPTTFFQCMWNTCWWYDCPEAAGHYREPDEGWPADGAPWALTGVKLYALLDHWRGFKESGQSGFVWVRSLRPPALPLGTGLRSVLESRGREVVRLDYSPDGQRLAGVWDKDGGQIWDTHSGTELQFHFSTDDIEREIPASQPRWSLVENPGSDATVVDIKSGQELLRIPKQLGRAHCVASTSDESFAAFGFYERCARVWSMAEKDWMATFAGHEDQVSAVAFSPEGRHLATASRDGTVQVWRLVSLPRIPRTRGNLGEIVSLAISEDGLRLATGGGEREPVIRIWNVNRGIEEAILAPRPGESKIISAVCLTSDGNLAAAGETDGSVTVWEPATGRKMVCAIKGGYSVRGLCFSSDGSRLVAGDWAKSVRMWDTRTGDQQRAFTVDGIVYAVALAPDLGHLACGTGDERVSIVVVPLRGDQRALPISADKEVYSLAFFTDGRRLLAGTEIEGVVFDTASRSFVSLAIDPSDVSSVVAGGPVLRLRTTGADTDIVTGSGDRVVCWFPRYFDQQVFHPGSRTWAGVRGRRSYGDAVVGHDTNELFLYRLEGELPSPDVLRKVRRGRKRCHRCGHDLLIKYVGLENDGFSDGITLKPVLSPDACESCGAVLLYDPEESFEPCPYCSAEIRPEWHHCIHCGLLLPLPRSFCPWCGEPCEASDGTGRCLSCGSVFPDDGETCRNCRICRQLIGGSWPYCVYCGFSQAG